MLVQFNQYATNQPLAVNPDHVVGVISAPMWINSVDQTPEPVTQIQTTYGEVLYAVTEPLYEVVHRLNLAV